MWKEGKASIYKAAKLCGIPQQTLRDRTSGTVNPVKFTSGRDSFLSSDEEAALVSYIKEVATCSFGFKRNALAELSGETSFYLRRRNTNVPLSNKWVYRFLIRWPELKMTERKTFPMGRAPSATRETEENYYRELHHVLQKSDLMKKPHRIYSLVETKVSQRGSSTLPSQTATVISCTNAAGKALPAYIIFRGKRKPKDLLTTTHPGIRTTISESGCADSRILETYFTEHFLESIPRAKDELTLVLYDGHNTHIPVPLINWARERNIVMFLLPPHVTNILQPSESDAPGPFEVAYHKECSKIVLTGPGKTTARHDMCRLIANAYQCAMTPENITAGFRYAGIFPFDKTAGIGRAVADDDVVIVKQQLSDEEYSCGDHNSCLL